MHQAYILLGSNINPEINIIKAIEILKTRCKVIRASQIWETEAIGSNGPNFLNLAVHIETEFDLAQLKQEVLLIIEQELGRIRTFDKFAPRIIDLDTIIFDNCIIDTSLWTQNFIALPISEIRPDIINPDTNQTLQQTALSFRNSAFATPFHPKG